MDLEKNTATKATYPMIPSSWGVRHKMIIKLFLMSILLYAMRFNLSIAIVAMVDDESQEGSDPQQQSPKRENICPSLIEAHSNNESIFIHANTSIRNEDQDESTSMPLNPVAPENPISAVTFRWNEKDQGLVLASFFWGYIVSQFPAGLLVYKYGGKWVGGLGMLCTALFGLALPQAAILGGRDFVVLVRVLQGFGSGLVMPSMVVLVSKWCSPQERASLSAVCFAGLPFGIAISMIVSGYLIPALGWPFVFYVPSALVILWFIMWCCTAHSCPEDDPSVSLEELNYLQASFSGRNENEVENHSFSESPKLSDLPWRQIATSVPFWCIFVNQFCSDWGHNMLKSEGSKYLHSVLHFDIHQNSYLSAAPYFCQVVFMILIGQLSDHLVERKLLSMLNARRLCNTIAMWGGALFLFGVILAGCNRTVGVICYILYGMVVGAGASGADVNIIDISPRYACALEGVINGAANLAGFGAPYVAGLILHHESSMLGWNLVFLVPVIANIIGNFVYIIGASVQVQPWNSTIKSKDTNSGEIGRNNINL